MSEELHLTPTEHVSVLEHAPEHLVVEVRYEAGPPPPPHLHPDQDERFEVLSGRLEVDVAGDTRTLGPGDVLRIPRGTPHRMHNGDSEPVVARWTTSPAGRTLDWFRTIDAAQRKPPGVRQAALGVALLRHRDVFRLTRG